MHTSANLSQADDQTCRKLQANHHVASRLPQQLLMPATPQRRQVGVLAR
jgi:hypothetical protein